MLIRRADEIWAVLSHGAFGVGACSVMEIGNRLKGWMGIDKTDRLGSGMVEGERWNCSNTPPCGTKYKYKVLVQNCVGSQSRLRALIRVCLPRLADAKTRLEITRH